MGNARTGTAGPSIPALVFAGAKYGLRESGFTLERSRLYSVGKISLKIRFLDWIRKSWEVLYASTLPLTHEIAVQAYSLSGFPYEDPADRLLIATAKWNEAVSMTADTSILASPEVRTADARRKLRTFTP